MIYDESAGTAQTRNRIGFFFLGNGTGLVPAACRTRSSSWATWFFFSSTGRHGPSSWAWPPTN